MEFDYIVIRGGTAGCVLANRLSADPTVSVVLLEAGDKDDYFWIDIPVGYLYTIANPRTDWCYQTEAEPGLNGRSIGYARGKVLGGCSSISADETSSAFNSHLNMESIYNTVVLIAFVCLICLTI